MKEVSPIKKIRGRRILLKMNEIKQYDIEEYEKRQIFHDTIKELKTEGVVDFSWEKYQQDTILEKVWLQKENIEKAYQTIKRKNPKQTSRYVKSELEKIEFTQPWLIHFQTETISQLEKSEKEISYLPKEKIQNIIRTLKKIDIMKQTQLKRSFSMECYQDSKYFEKEIERPLISIIRKYKIKPEYEKEYTDEQVLLEVGIEKAPEIFEFYGELEIEIGDIDKKIVIYTQDTIGSYLNSFTVKQMRIKPNSKIQKVLFIENKTNYLDYILKHKDSKQLIIYHGGMYSPMKQLFFEKVYQTLKDNENITFYHWSDIDIGGFQIFTRLKENIIPTLKPYLMDEYAFLAKKQYHKPMEDTYVDKLRKMLEDNKYEMFYPVMKRMLENNAKLEQEAFLG